MKIVIEVSDTLMEYIVKGRDLSEEQNDEIAYAIADGTPLPNQHGRLIDADSIISEINKRIEKCREEHGCYGNSYDARCFNLYNIVIDIINNAQTANIERGDEDV